MFEDSSERLKRKYKNKSQCRLAALLAYCIIPNDKIFLHTPINHIGNTLDLPFCILNASKIAHLQDFFDRSVCQVYCWDNIFQN